MYNYASRQRLLPPYYENPFERWAYAADDKWPTRTVRRILG